MRGQACTHLLVAHVLLRLLVLVDREVGGADGPMPAVVHGVGVARALMLLLGRTLQ